MSSLELHATVVEGLIAVCGQLDLVRVMLRGYCSSSFG